MSSTTATPFLLHIHQMRGLAVLVIVAAHVYSMQDWIGDPLGRLFNEANIAFTFVSGYLFQFLLPRFSYGRFLRRKLTGVVLPYLTVSLPALALYASGAKAHPHLILEPDGAWLAGRLLLTGNHLGPLWFIPMILLYYLAAPAFHLVDRRPWLYLLWLPALALPLWVPRPPLNDDPLQAALHYLPVYLGGMLACRWRARLDALLAWRRWPVLALLGLAMLAALHLEQEALALHVKLVLLLGLYGACLHLAALPLLLVPLSALAQVSFGVFFVHGYVVAAGRLLAQRHPGLFAGNAASLLLMTLVVTGLSVLAVRTVQRVAGGRSRWLLGC